MDNRSENLSRTLSPDLPALAASLMREAPGNQMSACIPTQVHGEPAKGTKRRPHTDFLL